MKILVGTNEIGQIVAEVFTHIKNDNENYQEFLNKANSEVDSVDNEEVLLAALDVNNIGIKAKEEKSRLKPKGIKDLIKNHNCIMMLDLMANDSKDKKAIEIMMDLREGSLIRPINKIKSKINKNLFEIPLNELYNIVINNKF